MPDMAQRLTGRGARRVLDLGSGTGRHTVFLARQGFEVYGLDLSASGLEQTQAWLAERGLSATLTLGDVYAPLPYADDFFDAVISVQVIHHAPLNVIEQAVAEIERALRPGGLVFITVPTIKRQAEHFEEVAPNTYLPLDGEEKGLIHYFFSEAQMRQTFSHFDILDLHYDATEHLCLLGALQA
jgi:SAM-dependent methyltransferase